MTPAMLRMLLLALLLCAVSRNAGAANRTSLRTRAAVEGAGVELSDLLAPGAPDELKALAAAIRLGSSPQPGAWRVFTREQLASALANFPGVLSRISLPEQIMVTRTGRALTRSEILAAIQRALQNIPNSYDAPIHEEDLVLPSPVFVAEQDPGLRVTRVEPAPDSGVTRFRLWTAAQPGVAPFWVAVRVLLPRRVFVAAHFLAAGSELWPSDFKTVQRSVPPALASAQPAGDQRLGRRLLHSLRAGDVIPPDALSPLYLVLPGRPAALLVHGQGFRIVLRAVPLQKGAQGERVRVRAVETGKVILARVVAKNSLEADF